MPTFDENLIHVGAGEIYLSTWAQGGTPGSGVFLGHCDQGFTLTPSYENLDVPSEFAEGPVLTVPTNSLYEGKMSLIELSMENLAFAMGQDLADIAGTGYNKSLTVRRRLRDFRQMQVVSRSGPGSTGDLTLLAYKIQAMTTGPIEFARAAYTRLEVTVRALFDGSVPGGGAFLKFSNT